MAAPGIISQQYEGVIPGHIREILALANHARLEAQVNLENEVDGEGDGASLVVRLTGGIAAIRRSQFIRDDVRLPARGARFDRAPFYSWITRKSPRTFELAMFYEPPTAVQNVEGGAVEEMRFADMDERRNRRAFWGTPCEVEKVMGLRTGKLERKKKASKCGWVGSGQPWVASWYPSGKVLVCQRGERVARAKAASHAPTSTLERAAHYSDPARFARYAEFTLTMLRNHAIGLLSGVSERHEFGECTIRYHADTIEQVKDVFDEALQALQAAAPTMTKKALALRAARDDSDFRSFLSRLVELKPRMVPRNPPV